MDTAAIALTDLRRALPRTPPDGAELLSAGCLTVLLTRLGISYAGDPDARGPSSLEHHLVGNVVLGAAYGSRSPRERVG
jgi:hypothetical protein